MLHQELILQGGFSIDLQKRTNEMQIKINNMLSELPSEVVSEEEAETPDTPVKQIRIGEGSYTFGSKKITIRVLNGKLVIRVGGGYMMI